MAYFDRFVDSRRPELEKRGHEMTIIAQDPTVTSAGRILTAQVRVPADLLALGPRSHRFHVVDYDATSGQLLPPVDLNDPESEGGWSYRDQFAEADDQTLTGSAAFHAQNVYAIAARTLAHFELALGRRLPWGFAGHALYLVPHAFAEANAYYSREDQGLLFGYLPDETGETVYTCLSHDIVAHETTHAILDGLRPRFMKPGLPDQAAFHEALADIVALLSVFSIRDLVESQLAEEKGRVPVGQLSEAEFKRSALFQLAEQFGRATRPDRGSALRRSLELEPGEGWKSDLEFEEPHRRGEVLVAAVMRAHVAMWGRRVQDLIEANALTRRRAAEEGAKSADHLLRMAIRSIDYAPALEFEFEDFLDAVLTSDEITAPDDEHGYRDSLRQAFAAFGIEQPRGRTVDLAEIPLGYRNVNFNALRADPDEVFRFMWQNAELLELDRSLFLSVDAVRPSVRVGPDGLIVNEVVADYAQSVNSTAAELASKMEVPVDLAPATEIQLWGGGTLIFDQFGMARLHQRKPLDDWDRQARRLAYLVRRGYYDTQGRLGFSYGSGQGLRFADLHVRNRRAGEDW